MNNASFRPISILLAAFVLGAAALTASSAKTPVLREVASGFTSPIALVPYADDSGRFLVVDQVGTVHVLSKDGKVKDTLFLDLRPRLTKLNAGFDERGALGLAFHPEFKENKRMYVYYSAPLRESAPKDWDHTSRVSEFRVQPDNDELADINSERVVLEVDQPYFNHNGGGLAFGPDGHLYIAIGDGGNANDVGRGHPPQGNGQDTTTLLGAILRIDVNGDGAGAYGIPSDNPFADGKRGRPEIYAYGFRNPWGISFDRGGNHELFSADVGQTMYEEINRVEKGGNYGWNIREGHHCFDPEHPSKPPEECPKKGAFGEPLVGPLIEYKHRKGFAKDPEALGTSVVGGYIYRGKAFPEWTGRYVFADWTRNWILPDGLLFVATPGKGEAWSLEPIELKSEADQPVKAYIVGLGQDTEGEVYVLTNGRNTVSGNSGKVFKVVPK